MVRKALLGLGMLASSIGAFAQTPVFHEGFDADQTKSPTDVAWYEFINTQEGDARELSDESPAAGAKSLKFTNASSVIGQGWQRAVKFRNLPLQEGKTYRLTFMLKGTNAYDAEGNPTSVNDDPSATRTKFKVGLFQGGENADVALVDGNGNEQYPELSYINPDGYEKYTQMFFFASEALNKEKYGEKETPLADTFFACFNIYNPGTYYLDEVELVEAAAKDAQFGGDVIRIDFGYPTNISELANAQEIGRVIMPEGCATAKVNGEDAEVEYIELHKDGYLYVFLASEIEDEDAKVEVSFTNPTDAAYQIKHKGTDIAVNNVTETATYNEEVANVSSFAWEPAIVISTTPANDSFCWPEDISEFTFTFDHKVFTCENDYDVAPKAVLSTGEVLAIKEGQPELSESITFVRTGKEPLPKGSYNITVTNVTQEKGISCADDYVISLAFETGKIQMAKTEYTKESEILMEDAPSNGIPEGWTVVTDSETREFGQSYGSGGRIIDRQITPLTKALYFRAAGDDQESYVISPAMNFPAGDIELRAHVGGWSGTAVNLDFEVLDANDNVVYSKNITTEENNFDGNGNGRTLPQVPFRFNTAGGEHKVKVTLNTHGYTGGYLAGYSVYTYKETPGDKFEPEVIFASNFTGGNMPAEGTGWLCYDNNNQLTPGSGRNGTSGMLERGFHSKMPSAAFFRECGANENAAHRIEYGNGNGVEGGIEIEAGTYDVTYYAGTWNDDNGNSAGTSKVFMQIINAETEAIEFSSEHVNIANFKNGGDISGQADCVEEKFFCKGGKYIIKAWGTTNTVWGALSIVKPGSKAAQYYSKMQDAVKSAEEELEVSADAKYNGTTKSALEAAVAKYTDPSDMHTVAEFNAALADIKALQDNMAARRKNIDAFDGNRNNLATSITECEGTKFQNLEVYPKAVECYESYKEVNPSDLDDATLASAVADMGNMGELLKNMKGSCVELLTKQVVELAAMVVALDPEAKEDSYVLAAGDAISDDQNLAANLKKLYAAKLYKKIGAGENPFVQYDEETEYTSEVEIAAGAFIQNRDFYSTAIVPVKEQTAVAKETDFPGWTIQVTNGQIRPVFNTGWGEANNAPRPNKPIADAAVRANWGRNEYDVRQLITNLPVAKYTVALVVAKDGEQATESYAYIGEGEDQLKSVSEITARDSSEPQVFENVTPVVKGNLGEMLLGGYINIDQSFGSIDKANLTMVGPAEGFDYAAAAAALEKEIADNVESIVAPVGEPTSVSYYDLSGKKVSTPMGIAIKVENFKNGYMKVSKVVVK